MEQLTQILLVSQEPSGCNPQWIGEENGWRLEIVRCAWEALERVRASAGPDLVVLDVAQPDSEGLHPLRWLRRLRPELPIVVTSDSADPLQKLEAIRLGAKDYLVRPLVPQQLEIAIERALYNSAEGAESEVVADEIEQIGEEMYFVAGSATMRKLRAQAELLSQVCTPVFILGESGSGKELAARLIHKLSVRSGFRFLKLDCATLPGDSLETELFGTFNGSGRNKPGKLELCHRGTLFLDSITEMPLNLQAKLLNVLRDGYFVRQGTDRRVEVDVRILATAQVNIEQALATRKLREDLYYRLSAFTVQVPALRQRKEEIPLLLSHFMNQLARRYSLPARMFSAAALEACERHSWPGNLRELEKFVKRYLVMGDGASSQESLEGDADMAFWKAYLPPSRGNPPVVTEEPIEAGISGLKSLVQSVKGEAERNAIASALEQARWNRKAAARLLKVSYRTLLYKIEQYHMSPPPAAFSGFNNGSGRERSFRG